MSYLLDSHAFYWLVQPGRRVPDTVAHLLAAAGATRYVSSVSAFELATKQRLGKFDSPGLVDRWPIALSGLGAQELPMTTQHALLAGSLDWEHRDPFDRLLAAQAISDGLTLVTADPVFRGVPGLLVERW